MKVSLGGLGACGGQLTPEQTFMLAVNAGFPPATAIKMVAIAMRESSLCPGAANIRPAGTTSATDPGEESYGLWQINVGPRGNKTLPGKLGLSNNQQLFDPAVNARAAYILWGGRDSNLNTAWYINRNTAAIYYKDRYEANLPIAQQAAANVMGSGAVGDIRDLGFPSFDFGEYEGVIITAGVVAGMLLLSRMAEG